MQRILVAEDEPDVRNYLELSLRCHGYEVEQAENGDEALRLLKRSDSRVSLVLLDIMMPFKDGIETLREIRQFNKNLPVIMLSGGSTPSAQFAGKIPGLTEIRPGTYAYNDLNTFYQGACRLEDCATRVVTTVVSTAVSGRAIIDAGSKTFSSDTLSSGPKGGYGLVVEAPDAPLIKLNEEHGHMDITNVSRKFRVGDVLTVVPNHVCTCVNMHDEAYLLRNEQVVGCWRIAARGKTR